MHNLFELQIHDNIEFFQSTTHFLPFFKAAFISINTNLHQTHVAGFKMK